MTTDQRIEEGGRVKDLVISEAGGGFMGVGPARYLAELEGALFSLGCGRRPLQDRAALLVGTSVGSIDMALLACGYSAADNLHLTAPTNATGVAQLRPSPATTGADQFAITLAATLPAFLDAQGVPR